MSRLGTAVELCCGMGGIGIGLRELGYEVVRAYDSWKQAVDVYNFNHGDVAVVQDLMLESSLSRALSDKRHLGDIDVLAAGPPCKGFSQLKNGRHDGRRRDNRLNNQVLFAIPDYVAIFRPRRFVVENVPALAIHRNGRTLKELLLALTSPANGLTYRTAVRIYDAAQFGTPQTRRRLLVMGIRHGDSGDFNVPDNSPDLSSFYAALRRNRSIHPRFSDISKRFMDDDDLDFVTAAQALSDLPRLGPGEIEMRRRYESEPRTAYQCWARSGAPVTITGTQTPGIVSRTLARLSHVSPGGCARDIPRDSLDGLVRRFDSAYRRLHPRAPSTALSTKYDCVYHYDFMRALSLREYARLQGIPDRIHFPSEIVCRRGAYEMIGNSVPPLLVEAALSRFLGRERLAARVAA